MISITLYQNQNGEVYRFKVLNHGKSVVCAGVSALVITCVNFIQAQFLELDVTQKHNENGGYIDFEINSDLNKEINLAIAQMVFGLEQIRQSNKREVRIQTKTRKE